MLLKTEGIKYAGSKRKIIPHITEIITELGDVKNVLDGFSGSTRVAQAFAQLGYNTTANDVSIWSEVFSTCYLKASKTDEYYQKIIDHLNQLQAYDGWFTQHYGGQEHDVKYPFQAKNTRKVDAIREEIEVLNLDWEDKCVILTSLIFAMDAVDSTLGHYVAYLNKWSPRSYNDLCLKLPNRFAIKSENKVIRADIFDTLANNEFDFVYFDPPYGSNNEKMPSSRVRYNSYYHIWTSIILNDKPAIFGKANRREDSRDRVDSSIFEDFRKNDQGKFIAMDAIEKMIKDAKTKYVLLSYSSGGRASKEQLSDILSSSGKLLKAIEINYQKNVMGNMRWTQEWVNSDGKYLEYLFLLQR